MPQSPVRRPLSENDIFTVCYGRDIPDPRLIKPQEGPAEAIAKKHSERYNGPMIPDCPTLPDTLLHLISQDGYSIGEASVFQDRQCLAYIDASKGNERWIVIASDRHEAVCELL